MTDQRREVEGLERTHQYLSTSCYHDFHTRCRLTCKWCHTKCSCRCHTDCTCINTVVIGEVEPSLLPGDTPCPIHPT